MDRLRRSSRSTVMKSKWIGTAIGLALCTSTLAACSQGANTNQNASGTSQPSGITLSQKDEKQIRDAIMNGAPPNGLKPDLFLKGGETGEALVQVAFKYASALANGYSDPTKL